MSKLNNVFKASSKIEIKLMRPTFFSAILERDPDGVGLQVQLGPDGLGLFITGIKEGPVRKFNIDNPDKAIQVGDRIIGVDENKGENTKELLECLQRGAPKIELSIARPPSLE